MDYYFEVALTRKVPTRMNEGGMDTAVCRAETAEAAVAQLLPEMRCCVDRVRRSTTMRGCYPHPQGILKECVI